MKQAVEGVAADMVISPKVSAMETAQMQFSSMEFHPADGKRHPGDVCRNPG